MRLWSLSPKYLDSKGLVALWREGLLAKKVLEGKTKGYKNHPQLERFKNRSDSLQLINLYLKEVYQEAESRGYNFSNKKLEKVATLGVRVKISQGQLEYEFAHLLTKLRIRDKQKYQELSSVNLIETNSIFERAAGGVEKWEKINKKKK